MKVLVDRELCEANAVCVRNAPEVFAIDADEKLRIERDEIDESLREKVAHAVARCPRGALKLIG